MRQDKIAARILLILSIVQVAVAAPAVVRQRSLDVSKDVTRELETRGEESSVDLNPVPQMHKAIPPTSGTPLSQDSQLPTSGTPPPHDTSPAPGDPQSHNYPFRWWEHTNWRPTGQTEQGETSSQFEPGAPEVPPKTSGAPQLQDELPPALGTPQVHNGPPQTPGAPQLQGDSPPASGTPLVHNNPPSTPGTPRPPPVHELSSSKDFDRSWRWVDDVIPARLRAPVMSSPSHSESEASAAAAAVTHLNPEIDLLKLKVKAYTTFGAVLGLGLGIGIGTGIGGSHGGNQN